MLSEGARASAASPLGKDSHTRLSAWQIFRKRCHPPTLLRPLEAPRGHHDWLLEFSGAGLWESRERLGASWGLLGALGADLGSHEAVLSRRWGRLGTLLGLRGAILGPV